MSLSPSLFLLAPDRVDLVKDLFFVVVNKVDTCEPICKRHQVDLVRLAPVDDLLIVYKMEFPANLHEDPPYKFDLMMRYHMNSKVDSKGDRSVGLDPRQSFHEFQGRILIFGKPNH